MRAGAPPRACTPRARMPAESPPAVTQAGSPPRSSSDASLPIRRSRAEVEHAFGSGRPFTLGVEEEVLLVDRDTGVIVNDAEQVLAKMALPGHLAGHEAF